MTVIEKIVEINDVIKEVFEFTQNDDVIKADFNEYLSTLGNSNISLNQVEKIFLPYVFERNIDGNSVIKIFNQKSKSKNPEIAKSLSNAIGSIFEVKKILKNGFELYNLINEKTYTVLSLTKMTSFRGVYAGQYIGARIFLYDGEYYVIEISSVLSHSQKSEAYRYAVMKLVQMPSLLYIDNQQKEKEIQNVIAEMYSKFIKTFNTDIILTTNKHADDIIGAFNDGEEIDLSDKICKFDEYKFFHVKELDNNYSNFLENSMGGFSSHTELYDVAVIFDKDNGLYAIPFYKTFSTIFENNEIVNNARECVEYFLTNDSIPDKIIKRVASEHNNFVEVVNKYMKTEFSSLEQIIQEYKSYFLENRIYSSATVLFCSSAFTEMFNYMSEEKPISSKITEKIGRNDLCPCGSGKKYKKCCGK